MDDYGLCPICGYETASDAGYCWNCRYQDFEGRMYHFHRTRRVFGNDYCRARGWPLPSDPQPPEEGDAQEAGHADAP